MKKKLLFPIALMSGIACGFAQQIPDCTEPFISEYMEGTGKNRAVEIYNPSYDTIDMSQYAIKVFASGPTNPNVMPLSGQLLPHATMVCGHPQCDQATGLLCCCFSDQLKFNGDDAVGLYKNDTLLDLIGEIGVNPGNTGWMVGTGFTKDYTLRRGYDVRGPTPYWNISQLQWDVHPVDDISGLADHESVCSNDAKAWFCGQKSDISNITTINAMEGDLVTLPIKVVNESNYSVTGLIAHNPQLDCQNLYQDPPEATFNTDYYVNMPLDGNDNMIITVQPGAVFESDISNQVNITIVDDTEYEPDGELICFSILEHPNYPNFLPLHETNPLNGSCGRYKYLQIIVGDNDSPSGINMHSDKDIRIYPTITSNYLFIESSINREIDKVSITNVFGQQVLTMQVNGNNSVIDISKLVSGCYFLRVYRNTKYIAKKIIKN